MKQYKKGNNTYNGVYIEVGGVRIINPTDETLKSNGYEQVEEVQTEAQKLQAAIEAKVNEIKAYDSSDAVNSFSLNGFPAWINREDRIGTRRAIELDFANGQTDSEIWLNGFKLVVNSQLALRLLDAVGHYAYKAYNVTQEHIAVVKELQSVEAVNAYDYKKGYPDKLVLKTQ